MTRVILSLQATHTALEALRRTELSCSVAAQVTENHRAAAKPALAAQEAAQEGGPSLPYGTSAVGSWFPVGGTSILAGMFGKDPAKDLPFYPSLTLRPSSNQEGDP